MWEKLLKEDYEIMCPDGCKLDYFKTLPKYQNSTPHIRYLFFAHFRVKFYYNLNVNHYEINY